MFFFNLEILGNGGGDMRDKLIKLMKKEGFILILFLGVCVVAGGTLFISMRNINTAKKNLGNEDFTIVDGSIEKEYLDINLKKLSDIEMGYASSEGDYGASLKEDDEEVLEVISPDEDNQEIEEVEENDVDDLEFEEESEDCDVVESYNAIVLPLDGPIITDYTSNSLIYSETLEAWVGHDGLDIKANEGTIVRAAADGVIKEVYEDELWGIVIVIDHNNELLTRYSSLLTKDMVKVGTQVKKGDHISKVGRTAKVEMLMEPHLHFEVIKNGKIIDPRSIIK